MFGIGTSLKIKTSADRSIQMIKIHTQTRFRLNFEITAFSRHSDQLTTQVPTSYPKVPTIGY